MQMLVPLWSPCREASSLESVPQEAGEETALLDGKEARSQRGTRASRTGQPCLRYVALENGCESKKTKPVLQIPDLDGPRPLEGS